MINDMNKPAVALEPALIVIELMNDPSPMDSTALTDVGLRVTVNGFWFVLNSSLIGVSREVEPSAILE